jgi:deoxyhypusine synthase
VAHSSLLRLLPLLLLPGKELRAKGLNRIGNMLVPNSNYCLFEDWIMPLLDDMLQEQQQQGTVWTPSKVSCAAPQERGSMAGCAAAAAGCLRFID